MAAERAIVLITAHGALYSLARTAEGGYELIHGREHATAFDVGQAHAFARMWGGTVVLLDQHRTVDGTIGRRT